MVVRPWSASLVSLAVLLGGVPARAQSAPAKVATAADEGPSKRAAALNDEAWALYEQGRYRAAIDKLEEAQRLDPNAKDLVYNLALIHEKAADLPEAIASYRRYLVLEVDLRARARAQATIRRIEGAQREQAEAPPAPAGAAGPRAAASLPAPAAPRPVRAAVIATGSVAGASFLLGSMFALSAVARNPGASPRTGAGISVQDLEADAHTAHAHALVADVSFGIAAAAASAALVLYFTTPRGASPSGAALPGRFTVSF